jgi:hypothetical protein
MNKLFVALFLVVALVVGPVSWADDSDDPAMTQSASTQDVYWQYAHQAYTDLLANFWTGSTKAGHIDYPCGLAGGCMWTGAQAANALYAVWKIADANTAKLRLTAHWNWLKSQHAASDFTTCGAPSEENYASDDTAWDISFMLQAYDVTHDPDALTYAKGALDCARGRWWDTTFGGGYWYDDTKTSKTAYQTILILDELTYYQFSGDTAYLNDAKQDVAWMNTHLLVTQNDDTVWPAGE